MKTIRIVEKNKFFATEVLVGKNLLQTIPKKITCASKKVFILVDAKFKKNATDLQKTFRKNGWKVSSYPLQVSETAKSLKNAEFIYAKMSESQMDRHSLLLAIGGGVITDLAGFIAGTYMRGIPWIAVPTTLLAQVDAAIGGKTALNHPNSKNLIGLFYHPQKIFCDLKFIDKLPQREMTSGLAEIIKIALISDPRLFQKLQKFSKHDLPKIIASAIRLKLAIVARDPFETTGLRKHLNLGHTFGHALETLTNYKLFRHGEAVLVGMELAATLSYIRGDLAKLEFEKILRCLMRFPQPKFPPIKLNELIKTMLRDKKNSRGKISFILIRKIGAVFECQNTTRAQLLETWALHHN